MSVQNNKITRKLRDGGGETVRVIDACGGMRGIYGADVFERCITDGVPFDCVTGVSAGAADCAHCEGCFPAKAIAATDYSLLISPLTT
jgi:predicted patatin/cPLA2 family phospholipase